MKRIEDTSWEREHSIFKLIQSLLRKWNEKYLKIKMCVNILTLYNVKTIRRCREREKEIEKQKEKQKENVIDCNKIVDPFSRATLRLTLLFSACWGWFASLTTGLSWIIWKVSLLASCFGSVRYFGLVWRESLGCI